MKKAPYMPFWIEDHLADTSHLDAETNGAYLYLMWAMWRAGGKLSSDDKVLMRIARVGAARWKKVREIVLKFFHDDGAGTLTHKRVALEIKLMKAKSRAAKAKADKRWNPEGKARKNNGFLDAGAMPYRSRELSLDNSVGPRRRKPFVLPPEIEAINRTLPARTGE